MTPARKLAPAPDCGRPDCPLPAEATARQEADAAILARLTVLQSEVAELSATIKGARSAIGALVALAIPAFADAAPKLIEKLISLF